MAASQRQIRPAASTRTASLARCAPGDRALPTTDEAKPHWGLMASRSRSIYAAASRARAVAASSRA